VFNKYKEIEYIPVEYPPASEMMAGIRALEGQIGQDLNELKKLLEL
jgi:type I restriction enzyme M protein